MSSITPVIADLMALIACKSPTPPGDVSPVVDFIVPRLRRAGARVDLPEPEPGRPNVIATWDFGPGPTLCFNTHTDVNDPAGQAWSTPPFQGVLDGAGRRVYGRGACDAKGSLAAMLAAVEALAADATGLSGRLVLTAVMGEEAGGVGTLHLVRSGFRADAAVVGEPTNLKVLSAHKGTFMRKVAIRGRSAHSGQADLGRNAIHDAAALVARWEALDARLRDRPHPRVGRASAQATLITGGTRQNTIPESATLVLDRRLVPGETHELARAELAAILVELSESRPGFSLAGVEELVATLPSETPADTPIVELALAARNARLAPPQQEPGGFPGGCDMGKLRLLAGIPTVILGPGSLDEAHVPDQFVEVYEDIPRRCLARPERVEEVDHTRG